jgi:hypothetical protein
MSKHRRVGEQTFKILSKKCKISKTSLSYYTKIQYVDKPRKEICKHFVRDPLQAVNIA